MTAARWRALCVAIMLALATGGITTLGVVDRAHSAAPTTAAFREVTTRRVLDTRVAPGTPLAGGTSLDVGVPEAAGAVAVVVSVTVTRPVGPGFLTLFAAGTSRPIVSTLNFDAGSIISNQATVEVDPQGRFTIFSLTTTHVVVDLVGVYMPATVSSAGRFVPSTPWRALDTRESRRPVPAGGSVVVDPHTPGSGAAVVTVTVTETRGPGFVTAHRSDQSAPGTSTLNFEAPGATRAVLATVALAPDGTFTIDVSTATHLVVDVLGWFTGAGAPLGRAGLFEPITPSRQFDTRDGGLPRLAAGSSVTVTYAAEPLAVLGNLTVTDERGPGFAAARPGSVGDLTTSSVNNDTAGQSIAAAVAVGYASGAGVTVSTYGSSQLIFDLVGAYVTGDGAGGSATAASVRVGLRESPSPFDGLTIGDVLARYPDAASTRAAVMTSDGTVHSLGQADVVLPAASTIKALVLGCTLAGFQDRGIDQLDAVTADLVHQMISVSDNAATTTLVDRLGGLPGLHACGLRFGATSMTMSSAGWGVTQVPPESFVVILRNLLRPESSVLDPRWVAFARATMLSTNISPVERWGIGAGRPPGSSYWVKDGWWTTAPGDFRYPGSRINSVGMIESGSRWWIVAVQGDRYTTQPRGIAVTELIADTINHNLAVSSAGGSLPSVAAVRRGGAPMSSSTHFPYWSDLATVRAPTAITQR